jgi:hypothetical protein
VVREAGARDGGQPGAAHRRDRLLQRVQRRPVEGPVCRVGHARGLVEQLADGDGGGPIVGHGEFRQVLAHGRVQPDPTGVDELHHGERGDGLAERGDGQDGALGDGVAVRGGSVSGGAHDVTAPDDGDGQARYPGRFLVRPDHRVDGCGIDLGGAGRRGRNRRGNDEQEGSEQSDPHRPSFDRNPAVAHRTVVRGGCRRGVATVGRWCCGGGRWSGPTCRSRRR